MFLINRKASKRSNLPWLKWFTIAFENPLLNFILSRRHLQKKSFLKFDAALKGVCSGPCRDLFFCLLGSCIQQRETFWIELCQMEAFNWANNCLWALEIHFIFLKKGCYKSYPMGFKLLTSWIDGKCHFYYLLPNLASYST